MLIRTEDIFQQIEALPEFRKASAVLAYWAVGDEVRTQDFIAKWYGIKRIILPVVVSDTALELREYSPEQMLSGRFGIMEPSAGAKTVEASEIDFAIIPGRQFDPEGNRKGHGKGYYDRLLPKLHCMTVGIANPDRIVDRLVPQPWDVPVKLVLTWR